MAEPPDSEWLDLKRDIAAFEESYHALLKTLKSFGEDASVPQRNCQGPSYEDESPTTGTGFQRQTTAETIGSSSSSAQHAFMKTLHDQVSLGKDIWKTKSESYTNLSATNLSVRQTKSKKNLLKLDKEWIDLHRANEDEADRFIQENDIQRATLLRSSTKATRLSAYTAISLQTNSLMVRVPVAHPHSHTKIVWDTIGCVLLMCDLIMTPIILAWDLPILELGGVVRAQFFVTLFYWPLDLVFSFNTAYYVKDTIIQKRRKIWLHYCRTWLLFDVLLISIDYFTLLLPEQKTLGTLKNLRLVRVMRLLRIAKLSKAGTTVAAAFSSKGNTWMPIGLAVMRVVIINVACPAHVLACSWYYIGRAAQKRGEPSWLDDARVAPSRALVSQGSTDDNKHTSTTMSQYLISLHWTLAQVTPAPNGTHPQNPSERLFAICVILFSLFVFGGSLAKLRSTLDSIGKEHAERNAKRSQLAAYLSNHHVPVELSARIITFAESQLGKARLVAKPPPGLLSNTLMDELLLGLRKPTLIHHHLLLLVASPFANQGVVIKKLCSEGLVEHFFEPHHSVFVEGTLALWCVFTTMGTYRLRKFTTSEDLLNFHDTRWFAEVCLFMRHIHSSTLSTTSVAETFTLTRAHLISCVSSSPIVVVSFAEYAKSFLALVSAQISQSNRAVPDYLSPDTSEQACHGVRVQLLDGKHGMATDWKIARAEMLLRGRGERCLDMTDFMTSVLSDKMLPELIEGQIRHAFPELGIDKGLFSFLEHQEECKCVVAAISSALMLMNDQYDAFVADQDPSQRLTMEQWMELRAIMQCTRISSQMLHAIFVFLLLRGLSKSKKFAKSIPPIARTTSDRMIIECLVDADLRELESISLLDQDQISILFRMCELYEAFQMPQFLQGENQPHNIEKLKGYVTSEQSCESFQHEYGQIIGSIEIESWNAKDTGSMENSAIYRAYLFSQICVMCGLSGKKHTVGSTFMNNKEAVPVLMAVRRLQDIAKYSARVIYSSYLIERSNFVGLEVTDMETLAISRLICLSRIIDQKGLKQLQDAWRSMSLDDKAVLQDHLTKDGIDSGAITLIFLPLYLSNSLRNPAVGTSRAFRVLVETLNILHAHVIDAAGAQIVTADIQNIADYAGSVDSSHAFENVFKRIKVKRKRLSKHFLVADIEKLPSLDFRGQVAEIYHRIQDVATVQARMDRVLSNAKDLQYQNAGGHAPLTRNDQKAAADVSRMASQLAVSNSSANTDIVCKDDEHFLI